MESRDNRIDKSWVGKNKIDRIKGTEKEAEP